MPPPATTTTTEPASAPPDYLGEVSLAVSVIGTVLSAVGLYLTWRVFKSVGRIREGYQRKGLIPKSQEKLQQLRKRLAAGLQNHRADLDEVSPTVRRIASELRNLGARLGVKDDAARLLVEDLTNKASAKSYGDLLEGLEELDSELDNIQLNDQWRGE